jgi:hypothetical protein
LDWSRWAVLCHCVLLKSRQLSGRRMCCDVTAAKPVVRQSGKVSSPTCRSARSRPVWPGLVQPRSGPFLVSACPESACAGWTASAQLSKISCRRDLGGPSSRAQRRSGRAGNSSHRVLTARLRLGVLSSGADTVRSCPLPSWCQLDHHAGNGSYDSPGSGSPGSGSESYTRKKLTGGQAGGQRVISSSDARYQLPFGN